MQESSPEPSHRSPWPKRLLILFFAFLPFGLLLQIYIYNNVSGAAALREALAEAHQLDGDWRFSNLRAKQTPIPDEENSALFILQMHKMIPPQFPSGKVMDLFEKARHRPLPEEEMATIRAEWEAGLPLIMESRRLVNYPRGQFPEIKTQEIEELRTAIQPYLAEIRVAVSGLRYDAVMRAETGDFDGALASCRAALCAARAPGDDSYFEAVLMHQACRYLAAMAIERVLALGEPSDEALAQLQRLLEEEAEQPLFLEAARWQRAYDDLLGAAHQGDVTRIARYVRAMGQSSDFTGVGWIDSVMCLFYYGSVKSNRAAMLKYMNEFVEIAKLPLHEQRDKFNLLKVSAKDRPRLVREFVPVSQKMFEASHQVATRTLTALVAVAAERYRLKHGDWPASVEQLTPDFLNAVPTDPCYNGPIRLKREPDGLIVYSVGPDGHDDGGKITPKWSISTPGTDFGFRLWDAADRPKRSIMGK